MIFHQETFFPTNYNFFLRQVICVFLYSPSTIPSVWLQYLKNINVSSLLVKAYWDKILSDSKRIIAFLVSGEET